ncbi:MAG: hypothetical protein KDD69_19805, partial [Bdellovibrionales bacterium]|nr:hypothetical protein [Bdellovibrionales bacterium]
MRIKVQKKGKFGKIAMLAISALAATSSAAAQGLPPINGLCVKKASSKDIVNVACTDNGGRGLCCDPEFIFPNNSSFNSFIDACGVKSRMLYYFIYDDVYWEYSTSPHYCIPLAPVPD